jgi:alpha-beta hydrolase superfamily lysophospholipase
LERELESARQRVDRWRARCVRDTDPEVADASGPVVSRDPKAVEALNNDPLIAHEVQPAMTVAALVRADERLRVEFPLITLPVLIMHGTDDKATVCHGSEFFYETAGSRDKTLKLYDGHYHDLLNDIGKEGVLAEIASWIDARLPSARSESEIRGSVAAGV